mgnify:FL=1
MSIPLCWKCSSRIEGSDPTGIGKTLIGCKENKNITSYGSAMVLCPLIQPKGVKHDSRICEGQGYEKYS